MNEKTLRLLQNFQDEDFERIEILNGRNKGVMVELRSGEKQFFPNSGGMPTELKLTTIASYMARGNFGKSSYRGNCSGLLIKDLIKYFNPKHFVDPMVGSGTSKEVCDRMGIKGTFLDLNPAWGGFNALTEALPVNPDFIFWHPPYFVFENKATGMKSAMPVYSGSMWGDSPVEGDGSRIHNQRKFTQWLNEIQANLYQALRKGGTLCILTGDSRFQGQFYSMQKEMDVYGTLDQVIIKEQHNVISEGTSYKGKFIPTVHEYLTIIKKKDWFIIPITHIQHLEANVKTSQKMPWKEVMAACLGAHGGSMSYNQIVDILANHPKAQNNNNVSAKVRQLIHLYPEAFERDGNRVLLRKLDQKNCYAVA